MSSTNELPIWLQQINRQLDEQYRTHEAPFEVLVNAYLESLQREEAAVDAQDILDEQLQRLQTTMSTMREELDSLKSGGGHAMDSRKYQELESKYRQAKQERTELLRTQSLNSQKLLELSEHVKNQKASKDRLEAEIKKMQSNASDVDKRISYCTQLVEEKNLNIQILQDELQALQLELLQTDERVKSLERENQQLVQRWLSKVTETVDKLNAEVELSSPQHQLQCGIVAKIELNRPISGLITAPNSDLIMPLTDADVSGRILMLRNLEESKFLMAPKSDSLISTIFSRDADMCIGVSHGNPEYAHIWNIESGRLMESLNGGLGNPFIDSTPISSTNTAIVSLHGPNLLRLYDLPRTFCLWTETLDAPAVSVTSLQIQNNDMAAVLLEDGRVQLWDIRQRKVARKSTFQVGRLTALSSDIQCGDLLACNDRSILVIDPTSLCIIRTINHPTMSFSTNSANPYLSMAPGGRRKFAVASKSKVVYGNYYEGIIETVLSHHEYELAGISWITRDNEPLLVSADIHGTITLISDK